MRKFKRLPQHIGVIPDGNRRWAVAQGMEKQEGYDHGIDPGFQLYQMCLDLGVKELTFYGFTQDNTKRPKQQTTAFQKACIDAVNSLAHRDAELLVIGNTSSPLFPKELLPYTKPVKFGEGKIRINFLVNYGWNWDLSHALDKQGQCSQALGKQMIKNIASCDISRVDLILRWGGRRRLSGFLPVQSIYSDFYIIEDYWPDFKPEHFYNALDWYENQDITLGG
ncbi:polyprenyl diphosphate synthase [Irregularibacter muris]|uniref:Polyprenyl diphosphate synthase n=1 Tax=Irregularibacter muris TaxID=1796619 RepID=A0AAE3HFG4_9FIRM|nr:polyprenyl diphosphate synthase [Irregularibacter muris]MCR1898520.1 polyprenyl diphosphate synthase [Irregularibacter muris]